MKKPRPIERGLPIRQHSDERQSAKSYSSHGAGCTSIVCGY
jgi:hypothetical protein